MPNNNNLYGFPQPLTQVFPAPIIAQRAPTTSDIAYPIGQQWIDEVGDDAYILVDVTAGVATWNVTATTPGNVDTLTGNSGGAITPSAGNINVIGAGVLAFAGSGSTLTGSITPGTTLVSTIAGNSGGARSPTAGAMSIVGSGALAFAGSGSTLTGSITPGTALASTLTGGSGGALSPTAGNFNLLGTANQITSIGSGSTITFSLPSAITAPGSITATTTVTATLGNITATNGNLAMGTAGNKVIVPTGANASAGLSGVMSGTPGAVTVATTACSATALVFYSRATTGGTPGEVSITAQDGTGFTLTSTGNETSTFNWWIINL